MRNAKDICLIMNDNSYVGREYASALKESLIFPDIILIGNFPEVDKDEEWRCGGLWSPIDQRLLSEQFSFHHFDGLNDPHLLSHLECSAYSLGIQGGTGILKDCLFSHFREGMISFHPGDLPFFRGCSAPEYQVSGGRPVTSTCHFIEEGIDVGDIIEKRILELDYTSYHTFRATVYPKTAEFVVDIVKGWLNGGELMRTPQNEEEAMYFNYIGDDRIVHLIDNWEK